MTYYLQIFIIGVCATLLVAVVSATIFNHSFRDAVLGGEGEAKIFGVLSVKGVAIVALCGLFLGGMLITLQFDPVSRKYPIPIFGEEKNTLIEDIAKDTNSSPEETKIIIELFLGDIRGRMAAGKSVHLDGFGTFTVRSREARKGRNPSTGETIEIQAAKIPVFTASKDLRDFLNNKD